MKKILKLSTLLLFLIIVFSACKKDTVWIYYDETRSLYSAHVSDKGILRNVKKILKSKQVQVFKVIITEDGTIDPCRCSSCRTGRRINCKISESDLYKALNEDFYQ